MVWQLIYFVSNNKLANLRTKIKSSEMNHKFNYHMKNYYKILRVILLFVLIPQF